MSEPVQVRDVVPVLRVADVERSMAWYAEMLGFTADPFFEHPYVFAILKSGSTRIMLRRDPAFRLNADRLDWDVYLSLTGQRIREVYTDLQAKGVVVRELVRMPYENCEFDIRDPDGYLICVSEDLDDSTGVPQFQEPEE